LQIAEEDDEEVVLSWRECLIWLAIITALISLYSESLVRAIEGASEGLGLSKTFIGVILIPIVGNAAEHASALTAGNVLWMFVEYRL
jgi:Ca2+:H+ antiporter